MAGKRVVVLDSTPATGVEVDRGWGNRAKMEVLYKWASKIDTSRLDNNFEVEGHWNSRSELVLNTVSLLTLPDTFAVSDVAFFGSKPISQSKKKHFLLLEAVVIGLLTADRRP